MAFPKLSSGGCVTAACLTQRYQSTTVLVSFCHKGSGRASAEYAYTQHVHLPAAHFLVRLMSNALAGRGRASNMAGKATRAPRSAADAPVPAEPSNRAPSGAGRPPRGPRSIAAPADPAARRAGAARAWLKADSDGGCELPGNRSAFCSSKCKLTGSSACTGAQRGGKAISALPMTQVAARALAGLRAGLANREEREAQQGSAAEGQERQAQRGAAAGAAEQPFQARRTNRRKNPRAVPYWQGSVPGTRPGESDVGEE